MLILLRQTHTNINRMAQMTTKAELCDRRENKGWIFSILIKLNSFFKQNTLKSTIGLNKQAITMLHTAFWLHLEPFFSLLAASQMAGNHHVSTIPKHVLNAIYVTHYNILLNKKKSMQLWRGVAEGETKCTHPILFTF